MEVNIMSVMVVVGAVGGVWQPCSPCGFGGPKCLCFCQTLFWPPGQATGGPLLAAARAPVYCSGCSIINKQLWAWTHVLRSLTQPTVNEGGSCSSLALYTLTACHTYCVTQHWLRTSLCSPYTVYLLWFTRRCRLSPFLHLPHHIWCERWYNPNTLICYCIV